MITRGMERRAIFLDKEDRQEFLARLEPGLQKTGCRCYAWVLMPNHVHLLIRTGATPLSALLRSLLTGYAVTLNHRCRLSGYLFQNRYKSILCQEETYFLEFVRYIHLNPVRAKMVRTMKELDRYPWSGHGVLVGTRRGDWQNRSEVLSRFGRRDSEAVEGYRKFVGDGQAWRFSGRRIAPKRRWVGGADADAEEEGISKGR